MQSIACYLTFNGNCREAMRFYKKCFGGKLVLQTVGQSSSIKKMPNKMKECIVQATLTTSKLKLMGTDLSDEEKLIKGNNVSLFLQCKSRRQFISYYKILLQKGVKGNSLLLNNVGALHTSVKDKFGNKWLLYYAKQKCQKR
jgi:PhnB protein